MSIEYQNKPIGWDNAGVTPPQDLIEKGFQPGYKPPAEYFNALLHTTSEAIKEIQEKTVELSVTIESSADTNSDTVTSKVICAGNDTEHKGGLYIGDTPISYGEADNNLDNSIVIGSADNVSGKNSIVSGTKNTCTAVQCLVLGFSNNVQGVRSIVAGESNVSEGNYGFIIGSDNTLCSYHSAIIGMENVIGSSSAEHGVLVVGNENTAGTKGSSSNNGGPSYTIICGLRNNGAACMSTGIFGTSNDIKGASDSGIFGNSNSAEQVKGVGIFGFGNISKNLNFICGKFSKTPTEIGRAHV